MNATTNTSTKPTGKAAKTPALSDEAREHRTLAQWKKAVGKLAALRDIGLTPARAYGCHELSQQSNAITPAAFEAKVEAGQLRILHWSFGLAVALDVSDDIDTIGHVVTFGWTKGGRGPLEVHDVGYVDLDGTFTDPIDMAGSDLSLPFTRTALPSDVMDCAAE